MRRSGFTLIELLVVIALMTVIGAAFLASFGAFSAGDPLKEAAQSVKSLIERGRSSALSRNSRFEMLVDFEQAEIHSWERRQAAFFGFESATGALGVQIQGNLNQKPYNYEEKLLAGSALAVWERARSFQISNNGEFEADGSNNGLAVSFDFLPLMESGQNLPIIRQEQWSVYVREAADGVAYLQANIHSIPYESLVPVVIGEWTRVEVVIAPSAPRFYVAGVPSGFQYGGGVSATKLADAVNALRANQQQVGRGHVQIGGSGSRPFMMDNLRLEKMAPMRILELEETWDVIPSPPGADVSATLRRELWKGKAAKGLAKPLDANTTSAIKREPMRQALILFDERGQLDTTFHRGAVSLTLLRIGEDSDMARRVTLEISPLGAVEELASLRQEELKKPKKRVKDDPYRTRVPVKK